MTWPNRELLEEVFAEAVNAAHPATLMQKPMMTALLDTIVTAKRRVVVMGAGKAAASMAAALEAAWAETGHKIPLAGIVATHNGYECETRSVEVVTASHPVPDERSEVIAKRMLAIADELGEGDTLIGLWSGGGSSLLAAPPEGVSMNSLRLLTNVLLKSGAPISDVNLVRRHLSTIAGGRLAKRAAPAQVINFTLPDVVKGEDQARWHADIASGPGVPDPTTAADALDVLDRLGIDPTPDIRSALQSETAETPSTWEEMGTGRQNIITFSDRAATEAAKTALREQGYKIIDAPAFLTGEARDVAKHMADLAKRHAVFDKPAAIVTGGELTVTVKGSGKGGPNQEFALALAIMLEGKPNVVALAGDTDGIDGMGSAAGALVLPDTLERMRAAGIDPQSALNTNDSGSAFAAIGDLLITGPTLTNLNDLRLIVING